MPREVLSLESLGACALRGIQAEEARFEDMVREVRNLRTQAEALEREALQARGKHLSAIAHDLGLAYPRGSRVRVVGLRLEVVWEGGPAAVPLWDPEDGDEEEETQEASPSPEVEVLTT